MRDVGGLEWRETDFQRELMLAVCLNDSEYDILMYILQSIQIFHPKGLCFGPLLAIDTSSHAIMIICRAEIVLPAKICFVFPPKLLRMLIISVQSLRHEHGQPTCGPTSKDLICNDGWLLRSSRQELRAG